MTSRDERSTQDAVRVRILAISSFFPWPIDRGDPVRVAMALRALNAATDLTVMAVAREDTRPGDVERLQEMLPGAEILSFRPAIGDRIRGVRAWRWVASLLRATPSWILNRESKALGRRARELSEDFDGAILLGEAAGVYAGQLRCPVLWDKSNVLGASVSEEVSTVTSWFQRTRLRLIARLSRAYERRVLKSINLVSVTSADEARRFESLYDRRADYINQSAVAPAAPVELDSGSNTIAWLGSFQYSSNTDGLDRLLREAGSRLRERGAVLRLIGSGATREQAIRYAAHPAVEWVGYAPSLPEALRGCRAAVVPLWSGAGVKLKTITLMAHGLPVVGTAVGLEGIAASAALALREQPNALVDAAMDASEAELLDARALGIDEIVEVFSESSFHSRVLAQAQALAVARGESTRPR